MRAVKPEPGSQRGSGSGQRHAASGGGRGNAGGGGGAGLTVTVKASALSKAPNGKGSSKFRGVSWHKDNMKWRATIFKGQLDCKALHRLTDMYTYCCSTACGVQVIRYGSSAAEQWWQSSPICMLPHRQELEMHKLVVIMPKLVLDIHCSTACQDRPQHKAAASLLTQQRHGL